jgi:hypothetical protein
MMKGERESLQVCGLWTALSSRFKCPETDGLVKELSFSIEIARENG